MRRLVLPLACLATAAAAAVVEPELPPPPPPEDSAETPLYSPATQSTLDWITAMEATAAAESARQPPVDPNLAGPHLDTVPGTGIQRCAGADGTIVFTDRTCESMGAVPWTAPSVGDANTRIFAKTCARTRTRLVDGLREALETGDANRVASYYHWTGMGSRAAFALMDRLHAFAQRPLVDVQLALSADPMSVASQAPPGFWNFGPGGPVGPLEPPKPRAPDLVRVDQMRGYKDAAAEVTYLHLTSNAGCWWVYF